MFRLFGILLVGSLLFGCGVSVVAGQSPAIFANRADLLVARDAWCADPTAAAVVYGPIGKWDVSAVTDLSYVFCASSGGLVGAWLSRGCNPACASFNEDISEWDVSQVTTLAYTFFLASSFNQPLNG